MNRTRLRRAIAVLTVLAIVAGSLTAQAVETGLASRVSAPSTQTPPRHTCTPTLCYINAPRHLTGGWPDPFLPALLLGTGLLGAAAWIRLSTSTAPTAAQITQPSGQPQERHSTTVGKSSPRAGLQGHVGAEAPVPATAHRPALAAHKVGFRQASQTVRRSNPSPTK
jgi:hypothetical protein